LFSRKAHTIKNALPFQLAILSQSNAPSVKSVYQNLLLDKLINEQKNRVSIKAIFRVQKRESYADRRSPGRYET